MPAESLAERLDREIRSRGPIPVSRYVEAALYDDTAGFYATTGQAGRRGDFLTAPEVGPLFGAVVARALDDWWRELGSPPAFDVVDWGAGPGTLARAVLAAAPDVLVAGALRLHLVERSAAQRRQHPVHDAVASSATVHEAMIVAGSMTGVVLANELLDNLPFEVLVRRAGAWVQQFVGPRDGAGRFSLVDRSDVGDPSEVADPPGGPDVAEGATVPWQPAARAWLAEARALFGRGRVVVFDYGETTADLADRAGGWLRTHRSHDGSGDWLVEPGSRDITVDVAFDQLQLDHRAALECGQAEWLRGHGIEDLVEEGRRIWQERAGIGDLAALAARSRIREAEALLDPDGMGAFRALEWHLPE